MFQYIDRVLQSIGGRKIYSLVGKSGTGKSFRAKLVAEKNKLEAIIDDGLLILDQKIIAGKSAKKASIFLEAVKTAIFEDDDHRDEVKHAIKSHHIKKILIVGTSDKMTNRIVKRLNLPPIKKIIRIEDMASAKDIETAMRTRTRHGQHVIPVPSIEVKQRYKNIFYDSIKVLFKHPLRFFKAKKSFEKSIVRPEYQKKGQVIISEHALEQMIAHCIDEFDPGMRLVKTHLHLANEVYKITVFLEVSFGTQLSGNLHNLKDFIRENIEEYTGIIIDRIDIRIDNIY